MILSSVALNLDKPSLETCLPLLENGDIDAVEWSFDCLKPDLKVPEWFQNLLMYFSDHNRLFGHGVRFNVCSAKWTNDQNLWLENLRRLNEDYRFNHITEHFGFMTGKDFHSGAPMAVPRTETQVRIARDRLMRLAHVGQCPVGLENLAFAFSIEECYEQILVLKDIVEPLNGFLILDLHNLYCQSQNFNLNLLDLVSMYPLALVREIHLSGGSWSKAESTDALIRRDTHDERVPNELFEVLPTVLHSCPNLRIVNLEYIPSALIPEQNKALFRCDFLAMKSIVNEHNKHANTMVKNDFIPNEQKISTIENLEPVTDSLLANQQALLSELLENSSSLNALNDNLKVHAKQFQSWQIQKWRPEMIETAYQIAQKWKSPT